MRVLIVEDDAETAAYLVKGLKRQGHMVSLVSDAREGIILLAQEQQFDILVVDRLLPKMDGLSFVASVRKSGIKTPILFLTALDSVGDRVKGLEAGGDDYLTKPFAFAEFNARLNALARRPPLADVVTVLRVADLELDLLQRRVSRGNDAIDIQPREFRLLEYLMRNAGRVVTRTMLLEQVWEFNFDPKTKIVETHISRLRSKVDRHADQQLIHTVRGSGYVIRSPS
jgi:two-component system OmpR family response regulator